MPFDTIYVVAAVIKNDKGEFLITQRMPNARYGGYWDCLLYTSPSPRDRTRSRMPSSA